MPFALGARHRAAGGDRLVVGMRVEQDECVRHRCLSATGRRRARRCGAWRRYCPARTSDVSVSYPAGRRCRSNHGGTRCAHELSRPCAVLGLARGGLRQLAARRSRPPTADHRQAARRRSPRCRAPTCRRTSRSPGCRASPTPDQRRGRSPPRPTCLGGMLRRVRRRHQGVLQLHELRPAGSTAASSKIAANRDDQFLQQRADGEGEPGPGQRVRDVRRQRRCSAAASPTSPPRTRRCRRSSGTSTPRWPGTPTSSGPSARSASPASARAARSSPSSTTSRRSRSSRYGITDVVEAVRDRRSQASFKKYPSAKVVFFDNKLQFAPGRPQRRRRQDEGGGRAARSSRASTGNESVILGKEMVKQHVNAVQQLPERATTTTFIARQRAVPRGRVRRAAVRGLRVPAAAPRDAAVHEVDAARATSTVNELSTEGWIAGERVRAPA